MTPRSRVADLHENTLNRIAKEYGFRVRDLSVALQGAIMRDLMEAYRRGAHDTHERVTIRPITEPPDER